MNRSRLTTLVVCGIAMAPVAFAPPVQATQAVESLPAKVRAEPGERVNVVLETPYDDPATEDVYEIECTDTWTTRVVSGRAVVKAVRGPSCDGYQTQWSVLTKRVSTGKAVIEFTRTAPDGNVVSTARLTITMRKAPRPAADTSCPANTLCTAVGYS